MKIKTENAKYPQNVIGEVFGTTSIGEEEFLSWYAFAIEHKLVTNKDKSAFEAYYKNGETAKQISEKMGRSRQSVYQRICKVLRKICKSRYIINECKKNKDEVRAIECLMLSPRAYNCLRRAGIDTVEQLKQRKDEDLLKIRNLGVKVLEEIKEALKTHE